MRRRRRRQLERRGNPLGRLGRELEKFELAPETRRAVMALVWFLAGIISLLALFGTAGAVGEWLRPRLFAWMGWGTYVIPFVVALVSLTRIDPERFPFSRGRYLGLLLVIFTGLGMLHLPAGTAESLSVADNGQGGGYIGWAISYWLRSTIGDAMTLISLVVLFAVGLILVSNRTPGQFFSLVRARRAARAQERLLRDAEAPALVAEEEVEETAEDAESVSLQASEESGGASSVLPVFALRPLDGVQRQGDRRPAAGGRARVRPPPYEPPPIDLLSGATTRPVSTDVKATQQVIQRTLETFGIPVEMGDTFVGPTVTQYTLKPAEGVKLSRILTLHNDLALALAAHPIRIEAPIPRKGLVGIEVPNKAVSIVRLREILAADVFTGDRNHPLTFALGKDVSGEPLVADLETMPHLLIAGATGSGKSVTINSVLISLLYRNGPSTLKLILIDPKRVELPLYDGIPHLLSPVITDPLKTVNAFHWAVAEMDRRYDLLSAACKRDIASYNAGRRPEDLLPNIILVVDELADIMARHARDVENAVIRLAQIARAVGIHLVLATQRPSVDVITGLIKANITSRIAFKVASSVDSRTILDASGAEKLLGSGDMLFLASGETKPRRLQGAYVSEEEVRGVVRFLTQSSRAIYDTSVIERHPEVRTATAGESGSEAYVDDELYQEAKRVALEVGRASTSLFQRRLRIGYGRAARIMDLLQERGIIGPPDGSRARDVLVGREGVPGDIDRESGSTPGHQRARSSSPLTIRSLPSAKQEPVTEESDQTLDEGP